MTDRKMSLMEHLEELRRRLLICLGAIVLFSVFSYFLSDKILAILQRPFPHMLVFLSPQEPFVITLKIALFGGIIFSLPVVIYQLWRFVASGLKDTEKKYILLYFPFSLFLFSCGAIFAYFVAIPVGLKFLLSFGTGSLQPMISVSKYLSFITTTLVAFGALFQLPLVSLFLVRIGIVSPEFLAKKRRYAIVGIFVLAAIVTPSIDAFTQILLAVPLIFLYEISVWLAKVVGGERRHDKQDLMARREQNE